VLYGLYVICTEFTAIMKFPKGKTANFTTQEHTPEKEKSRLGKDGKTKEGTP